MSNPNRSSKSHLIWILGTLVLAVQTLAPVANAATFTVDTSTDLGFDSRPGDGLCDTGAGECSLRAAVQEANAFPGSDLIVFADPLLDYNLRLERLSVHSDIRIKGAGARISCSFWSVPAFEVDSGGNLTLDSIVSEGCISTVYVRTGGSAHVSFSILTGTARAALVNSGWLVVNQCTFLKGTSGELGGAIHNRDAGKARVLSSDFISNSALDSGGAIYNGPDATMLISVANFIGNSSEETGGAIFNEGAMTIELARFVDNHARAGGGIFNDSTSVNTVTMSSFVKNSASGTDQCGGGLLNDGGLFYVDNSTFSQNLAFGAGAGLCVRSGAVELSNATVVLNVADSDGENTGVGGGIFALDPGHLTSRNSIVAANESGGQGAPDCFGSVVSAGYNLVGVVDQGCAIHQTDGDIFGDIGSPIDPEIDVDLQSGYFTDFHPLLAGSPAIDGGNRDGCIDPRTGKNLYADQVEATRHQGGACDQGAIETQP